MRRGTHRVGLEFPRLRGKPAGPPRRGARGARSAAEPGPRLDFLPHGAIALPRARGAMKKKSRAGPAAMRETKPIIRKSGSSNPKKKEDRRSEERREGKECRS